MLVKKKEGSLRFCFDYRRLDEQADLDAYPMPRIEELIDRLGGAQYLTTIYLARGLAGAHGRKSQGVDGICDTVWDVQFKVMPLGLKNASQVPKVDGPSDTRYVRIHSGIPR